MKFVNVFLHLMIAGCGEHTFVNSKMEKKANLRSVHAYENKSAGGVFVKDVRARATQEADDDGVKPVGAPGSSTDDGSVNDAHSADDHTSVDDATESVDDADDAAGHSADDHTSVDDAAE